MSTLQSKMAKQKRDVKKMVNNAAKKKSKKMDIDVENTVNAIKLQQMKSFDESQKPVMNSDKMDKNSAKKPPAKMNDVKIQVRLFLANSLHNDSVYLTNLLAFVILQFVFNFENLFNLSTSCKKLSAG